MSTTSLLFSLWILACSSLCAGLSPAFLWSNAPGIAASKVSYEVAQGTEVVLTAVRVASDVYVDGSRQKAEFVVAYLGKHADSSFFRQTGSPAGPLQSVLESASSWVMFQYASFQEEDSSAIIYQKLVKDGVAVQAVGCDQSSEPLNPAAAAELYMGTKEGPKVLLVCGNAADAAAEVAEVLVLHKVLSDSGHTFLAIYATETSQSRPAVRHLKQASSELLCGPLCKSQVAWLQGILAGGVLLIALISGLSCTYLLDSPSKFEAPKDSASAIS